MFRNSKKLQVFRNIPNGNRLQLQLYSDGCYGGADENKVSYVEHVQAIVTLKAPKRGDLQIYLTSPSGNDFENKFRM